MMKYYGCVQCQEEHVEDEWKFKAHIMRQSKHGIQFVSIETAIRWTKIREERKKPDAP